MTLIESVELVQNHVDNLKNKGVPIQPFIIIVGRIFLQKEILVYFDSIFYKVHSLLRSVEGMF